MGVQQTYSKRDYYKTKIFNKKEKTFLGREPHSWAKIIIFYLVFYGLLVILFTICIWVFFLFTDPRIPMWRLDASLIGTSPGLGIRPMSQENEESSLLWFKRPEKEEVYMHWKNVTLKFLDRYYTIGTDENGNNKMKPCSYDQPPGINDVCGVDVRKWGDCNKEEHFLYHKQTPCIFLKLNRIYDWVPQYYEEAYELPEDMPEDLKTKIVNTPRNQRKNVWVSCEGETPTDKEFLGPIKYFPDTQAFPGYYFPYKNQEGYLSPLIAVKIEGPVSGLVISVECRAWAKNIHYSRTERTGSIHFELRID